MLLSTQRTHIHTLSTTEIHKSGEWTTRPNLDSVTRKQPERLELHWFNICLIFFETFGGRSIKTVMNGLGSSGK